MATKKEGEQEEKKSLIAIRGETESKIKHALSKQHIHQKEVYSIVKTFFKELLDLEYEFTHEELIEELQKIYLDKKHHEKLKTFITTVGMMEYTNKKFSQEELHELLEELKTIIDLLIKHHAKTSSFVKFLSKLGLHKKRKVEMETDKIEAKEELFRLLKAVEHEDNSKRAKELYNKSLKYYNSLSKEEKQRYYDKLMQAYNKLKS
ncbi:MAG: hypothetical protein ACLFTH_02720 [Candidatus Woesearchaeota archaeon]